MRVNSPQRRLLASTQRAVSWNYQPLYLGSKIRTLVHQRWRLGLDIGLLLAVLAVAIGYTGYNIFHYPQYELDEGTYVSSAWTMITNYKLFYYTYAYAHPPLGWFQLGVWSELTGGFDEFGMSINSGRVFMLVITALSTLVIFQIVLSATGRSSAAAWAGVVFAASPLAISLHRQVYLDNIGTLWLLVSIWLLQTANGRLGRIILSAMAFGLAFLSKEVFVALLPGMLFLVFVRMHPLQRRFSFPLWMMTAVSAISTFTLLAFLKDELLPPGVLWSSPKPHVSLIETYTRQAGRGGGGLLDPEGSFWKNARLWWVNAPVLITAGTIALILCLLFWRKDRLTFSMAVLAGFFFLFLGRGGIVIYYYVIPLLAIMALAIGLVIGHWENFLSRWRYLRPVIPPVVLSAAIVFTGYAGARNDLNFKVDDTTSQTQAASWIVRNISPGSIIVMDSYAWQDLRGDSFTRGKPFPHAHYYWPLLSDPGLMQRELNNNWRSIDYMLISPNTLADARSSELPLLPDALDRSDPIRTFSSGNWSQSILRVRKLHKMLVSEDPMLVRTWNGDKLRFLKQGRVVVDSVTQESTSQGQANAMMRAVYANDRATFNSVWAWTDENLGIRGDGLLASSWTPGVNGGASSVVSQTMTEGDQDAALALLFAYKQWGDPRYKDDAIKLLNGIWEQETVETPLGRVVVGGNWARGKRDSGGNEPIISLPALSPYAYRIFGEVDPARDWGSLVDSTYRLLEEIRTSPALGGSQGLAPDVVQLDAKTGKPRLAGDTVAGGNSFTANGSRILWRLTIDYLWFHEDRAKEAIDGLYFFRDQLRKENPRLATEYAMDGSEVDGKDSIAVMAGVIPSLMITDDANLDLVNKIFATKLVATYTDTGAPPHWGKDPRDYTTQTWSWMTTAVMDGAVTNLWQGDRLLDWDEILNQR